MITIVSAYIAIWVTKAQLNLNNRKSLSPVSVVAGSDHCAVQAATQVEEIQDAHWKDLGMPETLWVCKVKEFGPLIVSIDTHGRNLFEEKKVIYNERKDQVYKEICENVKFIK